MKLDDVSKKLKATQNEIETAKKDFQVMIKQYQVRYNRTNSNIRCFGVIDISIVLSGLWYEDEDFILATHRAERSGVGEEEAGGRPKTGDGHASADRTGATEERTKGHCRRAENVQRQGSAQLQ